jgi:hypothetical protein
MSMLAIIAAVAWIVFDVVATVVSAPDLPLWESRLIVFGGGAVALGSLLGGLWDRHLTRRREDKQDRDMAVQIQQTTELRGILLGMGFNLNQTKDLIIAAAKDKPVSPALESVVTQLESKLTRYEQIFWKPLSAEQKGVLTSKLREMGKRTVQVTAHENTDSVELATDIKRCFEDAGWSVRKVPMTGTWASLGARGISVNGYTSTETLCAWVKDALLDVLRASVERTIDGRPRPDDVPDVIVLVGTKSVRGDD